MSDWAYGPGWWQASDGKWYPPESHPNAQLPPPPPAGQYGREPPRPSQRRYVVLSIVGVIALAAILIVVLLVSLGGHSRVVATFVPVSRSVSGQQLADDANRLVRRLSAFGDSSASVDVRGRSVVVLGGTRLPVPASVLLASGTLQFRPVLCGSAPYTTPTDGTKLGPLPDACSSSAYSLQAPNLTVNVSTGNSNESSIPFDPALSPYQSSTSTYNNAHPHSPVLLPVQGGSGVRYLLGPSELSGSAVASAQAAFQARQWVVDVTLTGPGAVGFDALSEKYFHEIIGIDVDGTVVSAPLTQPAQAAFTSFAGRVQISGSFSKAEAQNLAASFDSGPLAAPLRIAR
jgi:hypothetical protein